MEFFVQWLHKVGVSNKIAYDNWGSPITQFRVGLKMFLYYVAYIDFSDFLDFLEFLKIYRVMWMLKKQKFSSYLAINEFSDCEHVKRSTSKMKH